jgi:hypothetical protein
MREALEAVAPESERKFKMVYTIVEQRSGKKPFWVKVGIAFVNRDGSMNVRLDAFPQNGTLHIRDYVPYDEARLRREEPAAYARRVDEDQRLHAGVGA